MKRLYFIIPLVLLELVSCSKFDFGRYEFPLSREDAIRAARPFTRKHRDREVFASLNIIQPLETIEYAGGTKSMTSPNFAAWLIFVEPDTNIDGGRTSWMVFVNINTAKYEVVEIEGWPNVEWDESNYIYDYGGTKSSGEIIPPPISPSAVVTSKLWAVILSGGYDKENNYGRYWNNCSDIYLALTDHLGFPEGHIFCLMSDGNDPELDQRIGNHNYINSSTDLDGDGDTDVQYSATKANLSTVFTYLGNNVVPGDVVLFFTTDHGEYGGYIDMWSNTSISPTELSYEINKIPSSVYLHMVFGQCFSGALIPYLSGTNRTIATSCSSNELAYASGINGYTYFLKFWTDSIINRYTAPGIKDDNYLSVREMFNYAVNNDPKANSGDEHPQLYTYTQDFAIRNTLQGELIPVINGDSYISTTFNKTYSLADLPSGCTPTWSVSPFLTKVSSSGTTAVVRGNIPNSNTYASESQAVYVTFADSGISHTISKFISAVWKPGQYTGYISGSDGIYFTPELPDAYGYYWESSNSAWQIQSQGSARVEVLEGMTSSPVDLTVSYFSPDGGVIQITERVKQ